MCIATSHMHVSGLCSYCLAGLESICKVAHIRVFLSLVPSVTNQQVISKLCGGRINLDALLCKVQGTSMLQCFACDDCTVMVVTVAGGNLPL